MTEVFTESQQRKLGTYRGPTKSGGTVLGAQVRDCPTCSGTGKVVDGAEMAAALKERDESERRAHEAMVLSWEALEAIAKLLPRRPAQARELAGHLGRLYELGILAWDEEWVRHVWLGRLRALKQRHGGLTWEDLRAVTVRMFPELRPRFSEWRSFRMACKRAQPPAKGGGGAVQIYVDSRGRVTRSKASHAFGGREGRGAREILGTTLFRLQMQVLDIANRQGDLDVADARLYSAFVDLLGMAVQQRHAGRVDAKLLRRCQLLSSWL